MEEGAWRNRQKDGIPRVSKHPGLRPPVPGKAGLPQKQEEYVIAIVDKDERVWIRRGDMFMRGNVSMLEVNDYFRGCRRIYAGQQVPVEPKVEERRPERKKENRDKRKIDTSAFDDLAYED